MRNFLLDFGVATLTAEQKDARLWCAGSELIERIVTQFPPEQRATLFPDVVLPN